MRISRRDLLRHSAIGAAVAAVVSATGRRVGAAGVEELAPEAPLRFPIRLDRNVNAYGPSARVTAAMAHGARAVDADPDDIDALRRRIARECGVTPAHVAVDSGSAAILRRAADACARSGKAVITATPTFEVPGQHARRAGCKVIGVPLAPDGSHDLVAMLGAATNSGAGLVYICNPNNPTGTLTRRRGIERFLKQLPASTQVVIDEAYHHYVDAASDYRSFVDSPVNDPRVIVTRSFSKIHGLSGLRIGFAVAEPKTVAALTADGPPVGLTAVGARAAVTALDDAGYVDESRVRNADTRQEFFNQANARMLRWLDSQANFVMLDANGLAGTVVSHFAAHQIVLPAPFPPLNQHVRVAIGTRPEMQEFWRVWDLMPPMPHA